MPLLRPVSVKDRLPSTAGKVLVWERHDKSSGIWIVSDFGDGKFFETDVDTDEDKILAYITHWLPLPPSPMDNGG